MKLQKITKKSREPLAAVRRSYDDACGAAHGMDLVGERWALLVMRELMLGPKRFSDLRADLPAISANVLTQRLEGLEAAGIVVRKRLPAPVSAQVYELTPWGYESEPIFQTLGRWAARSRQHNPALPLSAVSLFLSFRTMFDPARAKGFAARIGFRIGEQSFTAQVGGGKIDVTRGEIEHADATFTAAQAPMIAAAVYGGEPLKRLIDAGAIRLDGDMAAAERFVTLFPLPDKAGAVNLPS